MPTGVLTAAQRHSGDFPGVRTDWFARGELVLSVARLLGYPFQTDLGSIIDTLEAWRGQKLTP